MDQTWGRPYHTKWADYAKELCLKSNISPERLFDDLRRVSQVVNNIQDMTPSGVELLDKMLKKQPIQLENL
jgi:hypothetical protein